MAATRDDALARMSRALRECEVVGPHTNVEFLQRIVASEPFAQGDLDTGLIERHHDTLFAPSTVPQKEALALACAALLTREGGKAHGVSPWDALSHWRMSGGYTQDLNWRAIETDEALQAVFTRESTSRSRRRQTPRTARRERAFRLVACRRAARRSRCCSAMRVIKGRVFVDGDVVPRVLSAARRWRSNGRTCWRMPPTRKTAKAA